MIQAGQLLLVRYVAPFSLQDQRQSECPALTDDLVRKVEPLP